MRLVAIVSAGRYSCPIMKASNSSLKKARRFDGISAKAYQHPADRAATAALGSVPHMDTVIRHLTELKYERMLKQLYLGNSVLVGPQQLVRVWNLWQEVLGALDLELDTQLYITNSPEVNAMAIGAKKPIVVIHSGLVALLSEAELRVVLAHEAAHILSQHVTYNTALIMILNFGHMAGLPIFARLPIKAVRASLLEWSRSAELSCDRAAALVSGDPRDVCSTLLVLAAGLPSQQLDLDSFIAQASEYENWSSSFDRFKRFMVELQGTHGFPVRRVSEVISWVQEGDWNHIINGNYPRRNDPITATADAQVAANFYSERFKTIIKDAAGAASHTGKDWQQRFRAGGNTDEGQ